MSEDKGIGLIKLIMRSGMSAAPAPAIEGWQCESCGWLDPEPQPLCPSCGADRGKFGETYE